MNISRTYVLLSSFLSYRIVLYCIVLYCMAGLSLDESSLTGEQQPREKSGKALPGKQYSVCHEYHILS